MTKQDVKIFGVFFLAAILFGGIGCFINYKVQRERFPSAPAWTHFFK